MRGWLVNVTRSMHLGWRGLLVCLLTALGIVSLLGFTLAHWTERQLFTTDNWLKIVSPLPKNNQVASAISDYSVQQLFSGINVEQRITDALPPRADFLAPTLTSQLQKYSTQLTKNVIQSDQFETLWVNVNKNAHQHLMTAARSADPSKSQKTTTLAVDLSSLQTTVRSKIGGNGPLFNTSSTQLNPPIPGAGIKLKLNLAIKTFGRYVRLIDFLNATLWLVALACLLGGLVLTFARRRLLLVIAIAIFVIGLLQLIAVKAVRPAILNDIQNASYRPAAGVVYDKLLANFNRTAVIGVVVGLVLFLGSFSTQPKFWHRRKLITKQLKDLRASVFWRQMSNLRQTLRRYCWQISAAATVLLLLLLAFVLDLDWQGIIRAVLILVLFIECINLAAARPRRRPM